MESEIIMRRFLSLALLVTSASALIPACGARDVSEFDLSITTPTLSSRVAPGAMLAVVIGATNTGQAAWEPGEVDLIFAGDPWWTSATLRLDKTTEPGAFGSFAGQLPAPPWPGVHTLRWQGSYHGEPFGPSVDAKVEVTCSDGLFCNGAERFVDGRCVAGIDPCDDGTDCTVDHCDDDKGVCSHDLKAGCASCLADTSCTPDCTGKACGDDGCGGECGTCPAGQGCASAAGLCKPADQPGTCAKPFPLLDPGTPLAGDHEIIGDTTSGLHQVVPTCNSTSTAVESVYAFTVTETMGFEARVYGYDTVLHLRKGDCLDDGPATTIACSDDSSPPGDYGSRVVAKLAPGDYYLIVDGFDSTQYGTFKLKTRFVAGGCVPRCDGRYCGESDGCGGDCGTCDAGFVCKDARCWPENCNPQCDGRVCGPDQCGGVCGTCADDKLCVPATGQCEVFAGCDHQRPHCEPGCSSDEFCGSDCACHPVSAPMPDLVVDEERLAKEILFDSVTVDDKSCAVVEQCVSGTGTRKVLRFSVEAKNQGQATLTVPPPDERPDLFTYSPCHGHYHFSGFARYALLDKAGNEVVTGRKQAYCMEDTQQIAVGPNVGCDKQYDCYNQGIQAGWSDLYGNTLDCQWLDITDVLPGDYALKVELNPGRTFEEVTLDNNVATVPVTIP